MNPLTEEQLLAKIAKLDPVVPVAGTTTLDSRARSDYERIVGSPREVVKNRASVGRRLALVACAAGIVATTSVGVAAASTDFFRPKADEAFSHMATKIGASDSMAADGQMLISTTLPNGSEAQYWESAMKDGVNVTGMCRTVLFSDARTTTTAEKRAPGGVCSTGTSDEFNARGTMQQWTSPQTGVHYVLPVLTAGNARTVQFRMTNGEVFDATVQHRRAMAVIPADLFEQGYTVTALDEQGQVVREAK